MSVTEKLSYSCNARDALFITVSYRNQYFGTDEMCIRDRIIGELYIVAYGGTFLTLSSLIKVLACMVLSILSCTAMLFFFMSFFKSATSFSNVTTIIGTLSGFLMGIYVPVGALPKLLQTIISLFPPSHCAALFRNLMMDDLSLIHI